MTFVLYVQSNIKDTSSVTWRKKLWDANPECIYPTSEIAGYFYWYNTVTTEYNSKMWYSLYTIQN